VGSRNERAGDAPVAAMLLRNATGARRVSRRLTGGGALGSRMRKRDKRICCGTRGQDGQGW
jgi:hypothetical protein